MIELQVIRHIHPVGQGAFYTETLHIPGCLEDKHIVYDCGDMPLSNRLKEEISDFLPKDSVIDILFISHFHADHVNGIKLLSKKYKIKNVVLPQIEEYEWFYILENYLTMGTTDVNLISDVRSSIGDAKMIQVKPRDLDSDYIESEGSISLDDFNDDYIDGHKPLVINNRDLALWHYIVVNPLLKGNIDALKTKIQDIIYGGRKLTVEDLHNPDILAAVQKAIQEAYTKIFRGGNEYSMCMLSELSDRNHHESLSYFNRKICCSNSYCRYRCYYKDRKFYDVDGALYSGDADFLHYDTLDCLRKRLKGRECNIGMLQIPHHGSKNNFNIGLLDWLNHIRVSFACFGSPNRYNHPSSSVIGVAGTYSYVVGVNQYKSNLLTERIEVYRR